MPFLEALIAYFIGLVTNETSDQINRVRERKLNEAARMKDVMSSRRLLRDEVSAACTQVARNRLQWQLDKSGEAMWLLLADESFQADVTAWLRARAPWDMNVVKARLIERLRGVLLESKASAQRLDFLESGFFEVLESALARNPVLRGWRQQMSLDHLATRTDEVKRQVEELSGQYPPEARATALARYGELSLAACDIIDLSNLPEGDVSLATQTHLMRQLYIPLRIVVEHAAKRDEAAGAIETRRLLRRYGEPLRARDHYDGEGGSSLFSLGERLATTHKLVILGEPGSGKTTMLRWIATAYLLRMRGEEALAQMPDVETLPQASWIPILIRCRDLGESDLTRSFVDFLAQSLRKSELLPSDADVMKALILEALVNGSALLLVDGLDEIARSDVRMMFCQELERTAARYPNARIVVTSRIVGYLDMPYRMTAGFEHAEIAELTRADRKLFAHRWIAATERHQTQEEKARRERELVDALTSTDRIERLASNPLLLTTLALVKRKVGKLPSRRTKLYAEAVSVLLNWNLTQYEAIDEEEAIPQLGFIAYEMCRAGVQRLSEDDLLQLLESARLEYPHLRPMRRRAPEAFLALLEARSSILVKSGRDWSRAGRGRGIWEFRHLTFQEYLASRALREGRFPGRDRSLPLAQHVAQLAASVVASQCRDDAVAYRHTQSWPEALRLLIADAADDVVDSLLLAIATPVAAEEGMAAALRGVLSVRSLADEPNVSESVATQVLRRFCTLIETDDRTFHEPDQFEQPAMEINSTQWGELFRRCLAEEFCYRNADQRRGPGSLLASLLLSVAPVSFDNSDDWAAPLQRDLASKDDQECICAALLIMRLSLRHRDLKVGVFAPALISLLKRAEPVAFAASWALEAVAALESNYLIPDDQPCRWVASAEHIGAMCGSLHNLAEPWSGVRVQLVRLLAAVPQVRSIEAILRCLADPMPEVRQAAAEELGRLGDPAFLARLLTTLEDSSSDVRAAAARALGLCGDTKAVPPLIAALVDSSDDVQAEAAMALGVLGDPRAFEPLVERLRSGDGSPDLAIIDALGDLRDIRAVDPLLPLLQHSDEAIRQLTIDALGKLGDRRAVEPLLGMLNDTPGAIQAVANALFNIPDKRSIEPLFQELDSADSYRSGLALVGLRQIRNPRVVDELLRRLQGPSGIRHQIAHALGWLAARQAVDPLIDCLGNADAHLRNTAAIALWRIGDRRAVPALIALLDDVDAAVRESAVISLKLLGDRAAVEPLIHTLSDPCSPVRHAAALALGMLGDLRAIEPLAACCREEDSDMTAAAAVGLWFLGDDRGQQIGSRLAASDDSATRFALVRNVAMANWGDFGEMLSVRLEGHAPWIDPRRTLSMGRAARAARKLRISTGKVQARYEELAPLLGLTLAWR